ncbi:MAG: hypothetical protein KTR16_15440 [Acidiferrobacterales bacterium]|nr:hypothetical protein [Acidiferrobacterales bacterium]
MDQSVFRRQSGYAPPHAVFCTLLRVWRIKASKYYTLVTQIGRIRRMLQALLQSD